MLEYFWLLPELGLSGYDDYRRFRKVPMGFTATAIDGLDHLGERLLRSTRHAFKAACREIGRRSPKEERAVRFFFNDMAAHCEAMHRLQKSGAFYLCVVGNSLIRRVTVPTVQILVELFQSAGYRVEDRIKYEIRRHYMKFPRRSNSGIIKQDHILVLRR
jgi:hypothetical protein